MNIRGGNSELLGVLLMFVFSSIFVIFISFLINYIEKKYRIIRYDTIDGLRYAAQYRHKFKWQNIGMKYWYNYSTGNFDPSKLDNMVIISEMMFLRMDKQDVIDVINLHKQQQNKGSDVVKHIEYIN